MNAIPMQPIPSQILKVTTSGQQLQIAIFQKSTGLFLSLKIEGVPAVDMVLCHDRVRLVRQAYLGMIGDLCFMDTQGLQDPSYDGLGSRYLLLYLTPDDVASNA